ncbi:Aste57867_5973 [Aphanomyces stellatus]|uniref:Aste57867_5973 protein n=1 Tax=Aphanomyces stellatus TaxID=120398 RepID=A0A485KHN3_9STRA|nr:hypothetical protein As57867_005959 [Aphanomyces stellatus]VFT82990.1 Aste57867_5973 [Aphanomyces stellatus]
MKREDVDCAFYLPNCNHDTLFQPSYVRCQKSQGQKILRCFPHCCPRHIHYRNCGCSLNLHVHTPPTSTSSSSDTLKAFAKFTHVDDVDEWHVGDRIKPDGVLKDLRSRDTPFHTWIPGRVEWIKASTLSFHFDEKNGDGWHYGWKSGRSRSQRTSGHVLKAYVVDTTQSDAWVVVGRTQSTPFTITSYRGEHNKKKKSSLGLAAHHLHHPPTTTTASPLGSHLASTLHLAGHSSSDDEGHSSVFSSPSPVVPIPMHHDIARLYSLLHVLLMNDCPLAIWAPFEDSWMAAKGFYANSFLPHVHRPASAVAPDALSLGLHVVASLGAIADRVQALLVRHGNAVLHKREVLAVYDECMSLLQAQLGHVLQSHGSSVLDLLRHLPPCPHPDASNHLFRLFVAQMRETYIATQHDDRPKSVIPAGPSIYDGTWVWLPRQTSFTLWSLSLSVMGYLRWTANLMACTQTRQGTTIQIRSCTPWFVSVPMALELDQAPHSLRVLPSGESCLAGTLAIDYVGTISEQHMRMEVYVHSLGSVHVVHVHVEPRRDARGNVDLVAHVQIDHVVSLPVDDTLDAASRMARVQQCVARTCVVKMSAVYEQRRRSPMAH